MQLFSVVITLVGAILGCQAAQKVSDSPLQLTVTSSRLPTPRFNGKAVYDGDDSIFLISGSNTAVIRYSLASGAVENLGDFVSLNAGAAFLDRDNIYHFGGYSSGPGYIADVSAFSTTARNGSVVNTLPPAGLSGIALAAPSGANSAYIFGGFNASSIETDQILVYNAEANTLRAHGRLPFPKSYSSAAWDTKRGVAYIFGGQLLTSYKDLLRYTPGLNGTDGAAVKLSTELPSGTTSSSAFYSDVDDKVYIFGGSELMRFDPETEEVEAVLVANWPVNFGGMACTYVPKMGRIYVLGGFEKTDSPYTHYRDEIAYIQLTASEEPAPEGPCGNDGATKLVPDPVCCESFYFCHGGEGTKHQCTEGEQFNPATAQCDTAAVVGCGIHYNPLIN